MTTKYATAEDLAARLSSAYTVPADADKLLDKASELIEYATQGRSELMVNPPANYDIDAAILADIVDKLKKATCDQVEYWLEVGEEQDVTQLRGEMNAGKLRVTQLPPQLAPRARRLLLSAGILWAGANVYTDISGGTGFASQAEGVI